ncbi:MAG: class 1 fructose-bisphosphatase [Candidatus Bathyarchaeia archaeon]|nr:fructose-1,6-bisphosphatase [Candidatus Bathyarchaeota archaeon]
MVSWMKVNLRDHLGGVRTDLASLILKICEICDIISDGIAYRMGRAETRNIFEEFQTTLDIWADNLFIEELARTGLVRTLFSEEQRKPVRIDDYGVFDVAIDPVDGSSNLRSNNLVASIISIYEKRMPTRGRDQIASMYILYGPVTSMVYTVGEGVHEMLRTKEGFMLSRENLELPEPGELYSVGGLRKDWPPKIKAYIERLEGEGLKLRYGGSLVGDFNQILHYGGIYAYPTLISSPEGKLRLIFESNPVAYIVEQAGGSSSNGEKSILDIEPESLTQRTPTYLGNKGLIRRLEKDLKDSEK